MEGVVIILLFVGVIAVTALIFCVWVIAMVLRLVLRGIGTLFMAPRVGARKSGWTMTEHRTTGDSVICASQRCRAANPAGARFCRRCGQPITTTRVGVTRAACW